MYNHKIKVKIEHFSFLKLYHTCMSMFYHFQYFEHIEETEWAIEECLRSELPVILIKISLMVLAADHNHNHNHNHTNMSLPRWRQRCASAPRATCTGTRLRSARSGWPEQVDNNILFIKIIITMLIIGVSIIITATVLTVILIRSSCGWCELPL